MYGVTLKKAYKTAFDFIMPTQTVTKNIPPYICRIPESQCEAVIVLCIPVLTENKKDYRLTRLRAGNFLSIPVKIKQ